jgi:histone demethylase JARID1
VDYGLECVKLYKAFRKQPCFSHDELLITAVQNMNVTENDVWLRRGLTELRERELGERNRVRFKRLKEQLLSDEAKESQCEFCHCYSYLSFISCRCTDKIVCLDHMSEVRFL